MLRYIGRPTSGVAYSVIVAVVASTLCFASCGKETEKSDQSAGDETPAVIEPGELTSFRLDNGINVYMREDRSSHLVAVDVLYRAGVIHENEGEVHVSRLLPHMLLYSPTVSFEGYESVKKIGALGHTNAEVYGEFVRFNYSIRSDRLELIFQVESERLTTIDFGTEDLQFFAEKCARDIDERLDSTQLSMFKYGLMAFNHAYYHGMKNVPIYHGVNNRTIADLERFRQRRYRLDNMVIVITGDFDTAETTELVESYFGSIEEWPAVPTDSPRPADGDIEATWDVDRTVMFLVYPGPYQNETERIVLTMFGGLLTRQLESSPELTTDIRSSLCSSPLRPVAEVPFFVFAELKRKRAPRDVVPGLLEMVEESSRAIDEKMFNRMKTNFISFYESSILDAQRKLPSLPYFQTLGEEALDIGQKHYLRQGSTTEEFIGKIQSITYDEARHYIESRLTRENMIKVTFQGE